MSTPKLRFPEFSQDWEEKKLGIFIEEHRDKSSTQDQHEVLTSARSGLIRQREYYDNQRIADRENTGFNIIPPGYITYRSRSDDRRFFFNQNNLGVTGIISIYYPVFKIVGGDSKFFIELLAKNIEYIGKYSVGTSQTVLSLSELKRVKLPLPSPAEQKKIAFFLSAVDSKLVAMRNKRAMLSRYKTGLMQQLFGQKRRFTRSDGAAFPAWEEKTLGSFVEFSKGKGISKSDISANGITPCIRYGELYTSYDEIIDDVVSYTNERIETLVLSKANDLIIPSSGESAIEIAKASCVNISGVALGGDINILRGDFVGAFFAHYLNHVKRFEIARLAQGNSVVHLYGDQLKKLVVNLPHSDEQRKIANILSAVDTKVRAVADQITKMEAFKRGLLQQMFV